MSDASFLMAKGVTMQKVEKGVSDVDLGAEQEEDKSGPLVLTERDLEMMRLIHEHRYCANNQIKRAFWKDRSPISNSCYRRIERLIKERYLEKGYSKRRSLNVYFVAERGYNELQSRGLHSDLKHYRPTVDFDRYVDHDMKVLTTRIVFREMGLADWICERVIDERVKPVRIPDGVLRHKGFSIAIEFENRLKSESRYIETLRYFSHNSDFKLVFMIMDKGLREWLMKLDYDVRKVWFVDYASLLKFKTKVLFENRAGSFLLNRIL